MKSVMIPVNNRVTINVPKEAFGPETVNIWYAIAFSLGCLAVISLTAKS